MRLLPAFVVVAGVAACSNGGVHVSSTCPMYFNPGLPGSCDPRADAGTPGACANPPPSSSCEPLPKECVSNPTCDCIACNSECGACTSEGNGLYSDGGGGGATCSYDSSSGTFTLTCINA